MGVHIDHLEDHLQALLQQEASSSYRSFDYLGVQRASTPSYQLPSEGSYEQQPQSEQWKMVPRDRWEIGQWFYQLVADFDEFPREFAMVAMDYLDRYISRVKDLNKGEVQLLALTCFYLAVKLFQAGPVLSTKQVAVLSRGQFHAKHVGAMELQILFTLNFSLHPPCSADFLRPYVRILVTKCPELRDKCLRYDLLELALEMLHGAVLDYFFVAHDLPQSHLAAAALLNAVDVFVPDVDILDVLCTSGCWLNATKVKACRERLWNIALVPRYSASKNHLSGAKSMQLSPSASGESSPSSCLFHSSMTSTDGLQVPNLGIHPE